jgi:AraC-like DNA-binding protein
LGNDRGGSNRRGEVCHAAARSVTPILQSSCTILQSRGGGFPGARAGVEGSNCPKARKTKPLSPSPVNTDVYAEIAELVARYAKDDNPSPRSTVCTSPAAARRPSGRLHVDQRPSFWLVASGRKCLTVGDEELHYGVGDCLLVALDLPATARITQASEAEPHLCVGRGDQSGPAGRADRPAARAGRGDAGRHARRGGHRRVAELLDATLRLLRLLDRPQDVAAMAPLIEQEILYRLLSGPCGARLMHVAMAEGQGQRVTRAVAWLREHFAQPLRIEVLAEHVGMSESSLHHHFKAVTGMTPMQYQKQLRLYEARAPDAGRRIGCRRGRLQRRLPEPSQFSREYRRLYGLSPARDVEALRAPIAAE